MFKKLVCIALSAAMMFSMVYASADVTSDSETSSEEYGLISALGIFGSENNSAPLTRAQFAKYLWNALNLAKPENVQKIFSDVSAENEISYLASYGYFKGSGGAFYPDREMTLSEAYITVARVLGYSVQAEANGGTDAAYAMVAKRVGLDENVLTSDGLTLKNAAVILYNMLTVPVFEIKSIDGSEIIYTSKNSDNLLETIYGIKISEGVVTATSYASIYENIDNADDNSLRIGKEEYACTLDNSDMFLGRYVRAYYDDNGKGKNIVFIYADDESDACLEIDAKDFVNFEKNTISYKKGDNTKKISLAKDAVFVYNGKSMLLASTAEKLAALKMDYGSIKLYKSGKSSYYTVIITKYENAVVSSADAENEIVYAEKTDGTAVKFEKSNAGFFEIYNAISGVKMSLTDLKNGDCISYVLSDNGNYAKIYLCGESVVGEITSVSEKNGEKSIVVNDQTYAVNKAFAAETNIEVGLSTSFVLDVFGNIAFEKDEKRVNSSSAAYFYDISNNNGGLESSVKIKVYTPSGKHEVLTIAKKCRIDGVGGKAPSDVYNALTDIGGEAVRSMIAYKTNAEGMITSIDTAAASVDACEDKNTLYTMAGAQDRTYRAEQSTGYYMFVPKSGDSETIGYYLDNSTVVFHVPTADEKITSDKEHLFSVGKPTGITNGYDFNVSIYKFNDDSPYADYVVVHDADYSRASLKETAYVVNNITRRLTDDGEEVVTSIQVLPDNGDATQEVLVADFAYLELSADNEIKVDADKISDYISPGDIIQYRITTTSKNLDGKYRYLRLLYDYSEDKPYWSDGTSAGAYENKTYTEWKNASGTEKYRFVLGNVESLYIEHNFIDLQNTKSVISISDDNHEIKDVIARQTGWTRLTCFDSSRQEWEKAYRAIVGDVVDYKYGGDDASRIFVRWTSERPVGFIVYR